jgi:hypothetical protein
MILESGRHTNVHSNDLHLISWGEMTSEDDVWGRVELRVARLAREGENLAALKELDHFLATEPAPAVVSSALSYRSMVKEEAGDHRGAFEDELQAHALSLPGTYSRYTKELSLGSLSIICGQEEKAISWFLAALNTARDGESISAGAALRKFLELRGEAQLDPAERTLCIEVIRRSWKVLRQSGEPDVTNLMQAANRLRELGSRPPYDRDTSSQP